MVSIFDLKTSVEELSSANEGTSRMDYEQHPPTRSVQGANFPNGAIHFRWQTSGQKWWLPSRSYLRMRCLLGKSSAAGVTEGLELSDDIAPNMDLCASLFQNMEFRINDKTVSRVSDFVPQVDALETRLRKSSSHIDTVGNATNFWQDQFKVRQQQVVVDGDNKVVADIVKTRLELGFDATQQLAMGVGGILTQSVVTTLDLTTVFQTGDEIEINLAGLGLQKLQVVSVTANTIQTEYTSVTEARAAAVTPFSRIRKATIKDSTSRHMTEFEITWQPPLSIFKVGHAMPSGRYELVLNPQTASVYKKYAIQSVGADKTPNLNGVGVAPSAGAQYQFMVDTMYMYVNTVEGPRFDDGTFLLDLEQTNCQSEKIESVNFAQRNFDVSPSTYALSVAYQDIRAGNNTQCSSSQFKSYNVAITEEEELKLNRFFINYAGQNLPAPDADPDFTPTKDWTVNRYLDTQIYSGAYFDSGGAETISQWHNRGAYYYFSIPRDGTDRSTRVIVNQQFGGDGGSANVTNMRLLLFAHSKQIARIRVVDGRVVDVQLEDA
jgi:hypothetical protein